MVPSTQTYSPSPSAESSTEPLLPSPGSFSTLTFGQTRLSTIQARNLPKISCSILGISCNFALEPSNEVVDMDNVKSGSSDINIAGDGAIGSEFVGSGIAIGGISVMIVADNCFNVKPNEMGSTANRAVGKLTTTLVSIARVI